MSGGSFNYLCCKDVLTDYCDEDLKNMVDKLVYLGYPKLATETFGLYQKIQDIRKEIQEKQGKLNPIWEAVELYDSDDIDKKDMEETIEKHLKEI